MPTSEPSQIDRLRAIQTIKSDPIMKSILAEFRRTAFTGSYIQRHQIEDEDELAAVWLNELEDQIFEQNKYNKDENWKL
jgi:hypothetical protein